jgi:hypothetical protein
MTTQRKTLKIADLLDAVNGMLRDSVDECVQGREAIAIVLSRALMDTGNYRGYRYIDGNEGKTDDSRRQYYRATQLDVKS